MQHRCNISLRAVVLNELNARTVTSVDTGQMITASTIDDVRVSSLGRYVFGSEISYNKAPPRLPGLGC
jgi:hypothetical protein